MSFICTQFKCQTVQFETKMQPFHVLPLRAKIDLGANGNDWVHCIPEAPELQEPHHQIV